MPTQQLTKPVWLICTNGCKKERRGVMIQGQMVLSYHKAFDASGNSWLCEGSHLAGEPAPDLPPALAEDD